MPTRHGGRFTKNVVTAQRSVLRRTTAFPWPSPPMNLEDIFRQVETNTSDLHDNSPSMQLTADCKPRREGQGNESRLTGHEL